MKVLCFLLSSLLLSPVLTAAGLNPVVEQARQRIEASDFRATGRLVQVSGSGERTSYKFAIKARWFPDGLRLLCEITEPARSRVRLLVGMDTHGLTAIKIARPQAGRPVVTTLPFERWSDGVLGTNFSFEDLVEGQFFWKNQTLMEPAKYGARDCFVLKSQPAAADRTHYGSVTTYIDRQTGYPVYVTKTIRGANGVKEYVYFGLRQSDGVWSASQIEARTDGIPGSSLLIIDRGSARAKLQPKDFDLALPADPKDE